MDFDEAYKIKVPVFEGPMDLLLHLIRENKVDIYDIPIALITRQYLEHLGLMKELDLDIAGEFLVMAATLIHIKSRMLLPVEDTSETIEEMDPRFELVQRLLQYQAYRDSALGLKERESDRSGVYRRAIATGDAEASGEAEELMLFDVNLFDLISAFRTILDKAPEEVFTLTRETLTVKDRTVHIMEMLRTAEAIRFEDLFDGEVTKTNILVTFVALLELLKLGIAGAYQEEEFGQFWVIRRGDPDEDFYASVAEGQDTGEQDPAPEVTEPGD